LFRIHFLRYACIVILAVTSNSFRFADFRSVIESLRGKLPTLKSLRRQMSCQLFVVGPHDAISISTFVAGCASLSRPLEICPEKLLDRPPSLVTSPSIQQSGCSSFLHEQRSCAPRRNPNAVAPPFVFELTCPWVLCPAGLPPHPGISPAKITIPQPIQLYGFSLFRPATLRPVPGLPQHCSVWSGGGLEKTSGFSGVEPALPQPPH